MKGPNKQNAMDQLIQSQRRCDNCAKDMRKCTYISMELFSQEQDDDDIKIVCVGCFAQITDWSTIHYRVNDKSADVLFQYGWSLKNQLYLLESLEKYGFNWLRAGQYIARKSASFFSEEKIRNHYESKYLGTQEFLPKLSEIIQKQPLMKNKNRISSQNQNLQPQIYNGKKLWCSQIVYNAKRQEFEGHVFDENAQTILQNLQFVDGESQEQRQIKFSVIEQYNRRLQKRYKAHCLTEQRGLVNDPLMSQMRKNVHKYEVKTFDQCLKPRIGYLSPSKADQQTNFISSQSHLIKILNTLRQLESKKFNNLHQVEMEMNQKKQFLKNQQKNKEESGRIRTFKKKNNKKKMKEKKEIEHKLSIAQFNFCKTNQIDIEDFKRCQQEIIRIVIDEKLSISVQGIIFFAKKKSNLPSQTIGLIIQKLVEWEIIVVSDCQKINEEK